MLPGPFKSSQTEPNMVILALSWPILGATCCQLGPSWAQLRPNFAKNLHRIASETSKSAPRPTKTTQRIAKWVQDNPGLEFSWIWDRFWSYFFQAFPSVSRSISHGLFASSSARWRLCARSALDIRRPPEGCRACVSLGVQLVQYQISNST